MFEIKPITEIFLPCFQYKKRPKYLHVKYINCHELLIFTAKFSSNIIQSCSQNLKGNLVTILFKNIVIRGYGKTIGTVFLPERLGKLKTASYANECQTTTLGHHSRTLCLQWLPSAVTILATAHLKRISYIFNPCNTRKKIMKGRGNCFDNNSEIGTEFDREMNFRRMQFSFLIASFLKNFLS